MPEETPIVYIVDDDPAVRDALSTLVRSAGLDARAYASAQDFLAAYDARRPGCVVLDIRMPDISGLQLQEQLRERDIRIPVVIITGHGDVRSAVKAMKLGAVDFIEKPFRQRILLERIERAIEQDKGERTVDRQRKEIQARLDLLSEREREVLEAVVKGGTTKEIAHHLGISPRTVEVYRARIMQKLKTDSVLEIVRMMMIAESRAGKG